MHGLGAKEYCGETYSLAHTLSVRATVIIYQRPIPQSAQQLAAAIFADLQSDRSCRVYEEALRAIWSQAEADTQIDRPDLIARFAYDHGWTVKVHDPGDFGMVADFSYDEPPPA